MRKLSILYLAFFVFAFSCTTQKPTEQESYFQIDGGKIWYKVIGSGNKTPIVILHGGPGFPSYDLAPLFALADDRQIIIYDQLGCGRSGELTDTSLMNIQSQRKELTALLKHLNINRFYLYGHSYGAALAVDYYFEEKNRPQALILSSPFLSSRKWESDADTLIASMDTVFSKPLRNAKLRNWKDTSNYEKAMENYYNSFYNRINKNQYIDSSIARTGKKLMSTMWGNEEFLVTGNLKNLDFTTDLPKITVPTLFTTGEFDAARPSTVRYFQQLTPGSKFVMIEKSGHSTMNDNTQADLKAIREFIASLEN
jgi:proline iminopeptidase